MFASCGGARAPAALDKPSGAARSRMRKMPVVAGAVAVPRIPQEIHALCQTRYYRDEKLPRMEDSFKTMVLRWGIPSKAHLDNRQVCIAGQFAFIPSKLGVRKIHHRAYQGLL